jgi:hypothetical protein
MLIYSAHSLFPGVSPEIMNILEIFSRLLIVRW